MNDTLSKIVSIASYVLLAVSVYFFAAFISGMTDDAGGFITWAYILIAIAGGASIVFGLVNLVLFPKKAKATLIGIAALAIVFGLAYVLSSDASVSATVMEKSQLTASGSHIIGMTLKAMYILGVLAAGLVAYTEISKMFK
jgi:glucan phosphoethanolaminetransferase (alkaline phosphatase superfamily)